MFAVMQEHFISFDPSGAGETKKRRTKTRMHSNRMRTARSLTVFPSSLPSFWGGGDLSWGGGDLSQGSSRHLTPPPPIRPDTYPAGPCNLSHDAIDVTPPTPIGQNE